MNKFVNEERKRQKMSMVRLAKLSGVHLRTIQNWLYGENEPTLGNFEKVVNALGYEITITKKFKSELW